MDVGAFHGIIGSDFYAGVPDSQLKALCDYLMDMYGIDPRHHIIAANEGNCVGLAAGYYLAAGKIPVVYMQNSGEGNIINPLASLLNEKVYGIPTIFVIGWRGEPGIKDEPQHVFQGEITLSLLENMNVPYFVISDKTTEAEFMDLFGIFRQKLDEGKCIAIVIKKGALTYNGSVKYTNVYLMKREDIIQHITDVSGEDIIISTTGKASRELFEIRDRYEQTHKYDFLTVGSMGHNSSIALGVALNTPNKKIWCIDGDGALLMHMGAMAVIGNCSPDNLVHIVINNQAHETVGGMPTVSGGMDLVKIAEGCGYKYSVSVESFDTLDEELRKAKSRSELSFIEVKSAIGARKDLGRPTTTPAENKRMFMETLGQ